MDVTPETGTDPFGTVSIEAFDIGVAETLGAVLARVEQPAGESREKGDTRYFLKDVPGVDPPGGFPGVPVVFSYPEDTFRTLKYTYALVRRDSMDPALQRFHPGAQQRNAPAPGANPRAVVLGGVRYEGWDKRQIVPQAMPYDLSYSIQLYSRYRQDANALLLYVLRRFPPNCTVWVRDSKGDVRGYEAFTDSPTPMDEGLEIGSRMVGFSVTLRVEAEIDLADPETVRTAESISIGFADKTTKEPA